MRMKSSILCIFVLTLFLQSAAATESGGKSGGADKSVTPTVQGKEKQEVKTPQKQNTVSNDVSEKTGKKESDAGSADAETRLDSHEQDITKNEHDDFESHGDREYNSMPLIPLQPPLNENTALSGETRPNTGFIIAAAALLLLLIVLIAAMAAGNYTTAKVLKQIKELDKRLLVLENDVKALKQLRSGKQEKGSANAAGAIDGTASFPDSGIFISGRTRQASAQKPVAPAELPDTISPLYSAPEQRTKRRNEAVNDLFLDISQSVFTRVQRGERLSLSSLLLEQQGTWRNSMFVLVGQFLYFNFHYYNEMKELAADSPQTERILMEIYDFEGSLPGHIKRCLPAKVLKSRNGYTVTSKGTVVIG